MYIVNDRLDEDEKGLGLIDTLEGKQEMIIKIIKRGEGHECFIKRKNRRESRTDNECV